jgi:heme/copper-type cytochrome/quinol oxidase subunit 2
VESWLTAVIVVPAVLVVFALFLVMWRERTSDQTARVAVMSGIVLIAWLIGTGILALRGFYFPPVAVRRPSASSSPSPESARAHSERSADPRR